MHNTPLVNVKKTNFINNRAYNNTPGLEIMYVINVNIDDTYMEGNTCNQEGTMMHVRHIAFLTIQKSFFYNQTI